VGNLPIILMEIDPDNNMAVKKTYIYSNGEILAQHTGGYDAPIYYYLHDRLGSVRQIIDPNGKVVNRYMYQPFGAIHLFEQDVVIDNSFKFTGQYYDSEIDQYYLRARQYYPRIQRFTARDPVAGKFDEPMSLHVYLYCQNEPVNMLDPSGLWGAPIHNEIIDAYFREALPGPLSLRVHGRMYAGSAWADESEFQDPAHAFMHAMRAPRQSVEEAQEQMWGFVFGELRSYERYLNSGKTDLAYEHLGRAMHPIMDWTSPTHSWQEWGGTKVEWGKHWWNEPGEIDPGTLNATVSMMESAMVLYQVSELLNFAFGD
jgi:RHS repeat-associated protein